MTTSDRKPRKARGAIYTVCFVGFVVPCVLTLGDTILQAALCFYDQQRIDYVAHEVIDHFESITDLEEAKFDYLFSALAAQNGMQMQGIKSRITSCPEAPEETIQVKITGRFANNIRLLAAYLPFEKTYKIKLSCFETLGYVAVNGYPYAEFDTSRGLSAYMPLYRPSASSPTWQFAQDNNIGAIKKTASDKAHFNDQKPDNWKQLADGLLSIY